MNTTKRILIAGALFIGFSTQASELTPVLQKHLTRDPANTVEAYVYDGTVTLNPAHCIETPRWSTWGLNQEQIGDFQTIFAHLLTSETSHALTPYIDSRSASIVTNYLRDDYYGRRETRDWTYFAPLIYTIPDQHIPKNRIVPVIPRSYLAGKIVGDKIIVTDTSNKQYDFKLAENRKANTERLALWPGNLLQALASRGFTGEHAQMLRFMLNVGYLDMHIIDVTQLQQRDATTLSDYDKDTLKNWDAVINRIVHGKVKKAESAT